MKNKSFLGGVLIAIILILTPSIGNAMHIMEGFLPGKWAGIWGLVAIPFLIVGIKNLNQVMKEDTNAKVLLGLAGGFVFVLSALKVPSVTGSSSHLTGVGLGAILFGPTIMTVIGTIVLLFQALLLAHGGLTTLGANIVSMGIIGPLVSYGIYVYFKNKNISRGLVVFLAAAFGNLMTYVVTATQLSIAFPDPVSGLGGSLVRFLSVFAVTQIPLAIIEGIITVIVYNLLVKYKEEGVITLENI